MLQVDLATTAMIVMRRRIAKQLLMKLWSHVAIATIKNGDLSKRIHSDRLTVRELMRVREDGDIAFSEKQPVVDPLRLVVEITNQRDVDFTLKQKLNKAALGLFSKFDVNMIAVLDFLDTGFVQVRIEAAEPAKVGSGHL